MEITDVRIFPVEDEKLKAFVSVVFDGCFMVNDIKVVHGKEGLFLSMPSRKRRNGEFKDIAHPLNHKTRRWIEERVIAEYQAVKDGKRPAAMPRTEAPAAQAPAPQLEPSLEEVEQEHLRDSFWGVS